VRQSLALAYVDEELAREPKPLSVDVLGISREARILAEPPYDPRGLNVRA
jgi:glycine cleavage system aminomethyltransferase T